MTINLHPDRARRVVNALVQTWNSTGVLGVRTMPEDIIPEGMEKSSPEHALFITLTVAIDYMRNADQLWAASRKTFSDPSTRYLFDPNSS
jgi:hypothetical protein